VTAGSEAGGVRAGLRAAAEAGGDALVELTRRLVACDTQTPPSDTGAICALVRGLLADVPGVQFEAYTQQAPVENLVATLRGGRPGPRLVLNGHLDTYPIGPLDRWRTDPLGGQVRDGRLYGRGSCDMKGGIAACMLVLRLFAQQVRDFPGELVLVLAGDEESMGELGTQALIDHVPACRADAAIVADVGSPRVIRCGEKGMVWLALDASGKSSHGAHVHRGANAIEALMQALSALKTLESLRIDPGHEAVAAMARAQPVSEPLGGDGERDVMSRVTVNIGTFHGGQSPNLVPDAARAEVDIRLPLGVSTARVEAEIARLLQPLPQVRCTVTRRYEATWTPPAHALVRAACGAAAEVLRQPVVPNMRVGASDARLWRRAGVPTVVCGLTPYNLGAADENLDVAELPQLAALIGLAAYDFLHGTT